MERFEVTKIRKPSDWLAVLIATAGGAGLSPIAPGTMGSLVGIPLAYWSADGLLPARLALWCGLTIIGTWAAKVFNEMHHAKDHQSIVVDEVIGMGITAWTAGRDLKSLFVAFVLFRVFDILKPPPVRMVDRWSKTQSSAWLCGFGVIADDILAAFQALVVMVFFQKFQILP